MGEVSPRLCLLGPHIRLLLVLLGICWIIVSNTQDIEDLDHYEMKEEEPVDGKKSEDDGIEKENLAILEKIRKNQRQDHLNVSFTVFLTIWIKNLNPFIHVACCKTTSCAVWMK